MIGPNQYHRAHRREGFRATATRRGAALVAVLVCLTIASVVVLNMLRTTIMEQRQLRAQRQHLQTERLAAAGLDRAVAQLQQSAKYAGETWRVAAEELGGTSAGSVTIRVEPINDRPHERTIVVQADYPDDPFHRVRKNRETSVTLTN